MQLTRRRLVFALRNKDGGAHFDAELDEPYAVFSQKPVWFAIQGDKSYPIMQQETATMRQIAWELLETLKGAGLA